MPIQLGGRITDEEFKGQRGAEELAVPKQLQLK
jgi:hypothetical protein